MLGVVPGGGDGGGYSLKCPALVRGGCALKGTFYIEGEGFPKLNCLKE